MTKKDKLLQKLFQNPKNVTFRELDTILKNSGFTSHQPSSGSSHYTYKSSGRRITIPFHKPFVKELYVKRVQELLGGNDENKK